MIELYLSTSIIVYNISNVIVITRDVLVKLSIVSQRIYYALY